jgi:hypothetical protein
MRQTLSVAVPVLLGLSMARTGRSTEPPKPEGVSNVVREQVQGRWRFQGDKLLRTQGRVSQQRISATALRYGDGLLVLEKAATDKTPVEWRPADSERLNPTPFLAPCPTALLGRATPMTQVSCRVPCMAIGVFDNKTYRPIKITSKICEPPPGAASRVIKIT